VDAAEPATVSAPDGTFYVTYDAHSASRAKELQLARIEQGTAHISQLGTDDGFDSTYPDIAMHGDRIAITWFDAKDGNAEVYLAVGTMMELTTDLAKHSRRITRTPGASIGAYLAWNGPRLLVSWCDDTPGQSEVYRQEFDAQGAAVSAIEQVTHTATDSLIPSVRAVGNGFALAWTERQAHPEAESAGHSPTASSRVRVERAH